MEELTIRSASFDDEELVGALLTVSFADDPFVRWILPDPRKFVADSHSHPRRAYASAFESETVHVVGNNAGAAVWLPPGSKKRNQSEETAPPDNGVDPGMPPEFAELMAQSAAYCPTEPHWYLGLIAVDPIHRGKRVGTKLLQHGLGLCDRDGVPAYLESTNAANLALYQRAGFELLAKVQVGQSPARYPMLRPAQK
ncbi:MAG: GNAT family N-acetyltransferase [Boseongicola sp.]